MIKSAAKSSPRYNAMTAHTWSSERLLARRGAEVRALDAKTPSAFMVQMLAVARTAALSRIRRFNVSVVIARLREPNVDS